uniref:(northern house mosquito) hypothetical protein n=1 Tax=Culex pipiens TaxID=7175 RepID=A0A8D8IID8_CULPI
MQIYPNNITSEEIASFMTFNPWCTSHFFYDLYPAPPHPLLLPIEHRIPVRFHQPKQRRKRKLPCRISTEPVQQVAQGTVVVLQQLVQMLAPELSAGADEEKVAQIEQRTRVSRRLPVGQDYTFCRVVLVMSEDKIIDPAVAVADDTVRFRFVRVAAVGQLLEHDVLYPLDLVLIRRETSPHGGQRPVERLLHQGHQIVVLDEHVFGVKLAEHLRLLFLHGERDRVQPAQLFHQQLRVLHIDRLKLVPVPPFVVLVVLQNNSCLTFLLLRITMRKITPRCTVKPSLPRLPLFLSESLFRLELVERWQHFPVEEHLALKKSQRPRIVIRWNLTPQHKLPIVPVDYSLEHKTHKPIALQTGLLVKVHRK